jgi:hypothetical protein
VIRDRNFHHLGTDTCPLIPLLDMNSTESELRKRLLMPARKRSGVPRKCGLSNTFTIMAS